MLHCFEAADCSGKLVWQSWLGQDMCFSGCEVRGCILRCDGEDCGRYRDVVVVDVSVDVRMYAGRSWVAVFFYILW